MQSKEKHLQAQASSSCLSERVVTSYHAKKIRDGVTDIEIKETLLMIFALIGIPQERFPDKAQESVLLGYIRNHLSHYSLKDFRLAFEVGVDRKLDVDITHFNNFNSLYLSNVLQSFSRFRAKWISTHSKEQKRELTFDEQDEISKKYILLDFLYFKNGDKIIFHQSVYKFLRRKRALKWDTENSHILGKFGRDYLVVTEAAEILTIANRMLRDEKMIAKTTRHHIDSAFTKLIDTGEGFDEVLKNYARRITVQKYYQMLIEKKYELKDQLT